MKFIAIALLVIALVVLAPIATIWAWNTLFGNYIHIATTLETWAAVVLLGGVIHARG
jgi:hypothetical protein